jgi:p-hydroxybenzoate 3-monooxygenase
MPPALTRTTVGIVGGGPAGLMLSHLLAGAGIASVVVELRTRDEIEHTHRAGILEQDSVRMLVETGVSDRVLRDGYRHEGIDLAFGGAGHRIDFEGLVGASVQLYPQTDVFIDLANARERDGGDVHYDVSAVSVIDVTSDQPTISFTDSSGQRQEVRCDYVVGADGSRSSCRDSFPESLRRQFFREYPFAWFGILCEAPPSAPELIYNHSERGFALISQRTETLQRMYFQCDPKENVDDWSDDRIWEELQGRVGANGYTLQEGPITSRTVLPFRSFVQEPMRHGNLLLAGDAAHTVPPTGAKGLNLAVADIKVLAAALADFYARGDEGLLDAYSDTCLRRVWRVQHFSSWMTSMLHRLPGADAFDRKLQRAQLEYLTRSRAAATTLAENYVGVRDA